MKVLITGGAGFIGSTVASCCVDHGITPVILDDYSTGLRVFARRFAHYEGDIADRALLDRIVDDHPDIDAVIHCAAKIVVPESVEAPLKYYDNNVGRAVSLIDALSARGVKTFLLSSTAAMYEPGPDFMVDEGSAVHPTSPYAASKWMLERVLADTAATGRIRAIALRYFNPIGADPQLRTGLQNPAPSHALGKMITAHTTGVPFTVTGVDWPTRDGSGLRDYVHVWDLARAHVLALQAELGAYEVINLGTGTGTTVLELAAAVGEATGAPLDVVAAPRREGDVVGSAARIDKAARVLGWRPEYSVADGVRHSLQWAATLPEVLAAEAELAELAELA
ncbi:UDP-glucose 4-epimerase GalE [Corynebacterium liangguodongii]|uniref:UDP-glucose 4-epimerase n=1 Tax=Corynebacterium liangguodongii TaxID=2079535 RepID=A0A2S0WC01_9CORY|nr:UDP-glucose 4-epimerase GalE [Corynebacterium liangguodongii]AWB83301.1 UDP-glucose 4-epimerase GalE [Corynebacterium liangguodongii]PWC00609.1 UDP-glucose 4-epimerase GalE [Corynebacterium liangguodongii]